MNDKTGRSRKRRLEDIALAVAYANDNRAQCFWGVALLEVTARHFGYALTPRAVSMVAQLTARPETFVVTGGIAQDYVVANGGSSQVEGYLGAPPDGSEFQRAGHLIATLEQPAILIDPTFGQFTTAGLPDLVPVEAYDPTAEHWWLEAEGVNILYIVADDNQDWQDSYRAVRNGILDTADDLAAYLDAGGEPHRHRIRLSPTMGL